MSDLPEAVVHEVAAAAEAARRSEWLEVAAALQRASAAAASGPWPREAALCSAEGEILRRCGGDPARIFEAMSRGVLLGTDDLSRRFREQAGEARALEGAGDDAAAAAAYGQASAIGVRLMLPGWIVAALERRRAVRLLAAGDRHAAWRAYDAAAERHRKAGDAVASGWVDVEQAHRACAVGELDRGLAVASRLELERAARTDARLRAELAIARGRLWRASGDARAAAAEWVAGATAALEAAAPGSCYAAGHLLAGVTEAGGEREEAYAVLESTREQLAALTGAPLANAWMWGEFEQVRNRWGTDRYEEIRAAHARARRAVLHPASRRPLP